MNISDAIAERIRGSVQRDVPLRDYTYMRVGGPADMLVVPERVKDLRWLLSFARERGARYFVMGNGTNLIFDDEGYRGIVIKTNACFSELQVRGESIFAGSGVDLMDLIRTAAEKGLSCLEQLAGIPGTVGGAIWMNAGAFEKEIQDCIDDVHYFDSEGNEKAGVVEFSYRESPFKKGDVIVGAHFSFTRRESNGILAEIEEIQRKRAARQPLEFPSAGSVFKNPPDRFAGEIIDRLGMKGMKIGDAQVSEKHANFIVNRGEATCDDIRKLIDEVRSRVLRDEGIALELEVEFVKAK
jgi:UDP-N-acetylmuramate dehydrogenase